MFGTLPDTFLRGSTILKRRRFRFPEAFGALLPAPFQARQLDPAMTGNYRQEVLRDKLAELLRPGSVAAGKDDKDETGRWRLENGELRLGAGSSGFRVKQLEAWQRAQSEAAVGYTNKAQPEALMPMPLLLYALSRLREHEWLAPSQLLPLWKMALPGAKARNRQPSARQAMNGAVSKKSRWTAPRYLGCRGLPTIKRTHRQRAFCERTIPNG